MSSLPFPLPAGSPHAFFLKLYKIPFPPVNHMSAGTRYPLWVLRRFHYTAVANGKDSKTRHIFLINDSYPPSFYLCVPL